VKNQKVYILFELYISIMENLDLSVHSKDISLMVKNLGNQGEIEILLNLYKKQNVHFILKEEIELALFNAVSSCVKNHEFDKLKMLIDNPYINDNLRLHAEMGYEKKKLMFQNTNDVFVVPRSLGCKKCTCSCNKEKLKNSGN